MTTTLFRSFIFTAGLLLLFAGRASAQYYVPWHRPIDVEYRQASTRHFWMIYQRGLRSEADQIAAILERSIPELRAVVGLRRSFFMPVVVNRFTDISNGFVTTAPFRQEIESVRIRGHALSPRFTSWFETVAPHELAHAVHAESGSGFGVGWILRLIGPDLARSLNLSGPRGINEGLAVWYESRLRPGAGRLEHSFFRMETRAAMLSGEPWSLTQMLEDPAYTLPFDRFYHGGALLFDYLSEVDGHLDFFRDARDFFYRFPVFGYGPALWYATGSTPGELGRQIRKHYRERARAFTRALGPLTTPRIISSERGSIFRRPRWISDSALVAYARGYHRRPGFYLIGTESGRIEPVAYQSITEDYYYSLTPDSSALLFSRYVLDTFEPLRAEAEIFRLDLNTGGVARVTNGARAFSPVAAPDGRIWFLQNAPGSAVVATLQADGSIQNRPTRGDLAVLSVVPAPAGSEIALLVNRKGDQYIAFVSPQDGGMEIRYRIGFPEASIYDASWSADGSFLLFSADPGGVVNVYAWERATNRVFRLTNAAFGAFEPSLSPDGTRLAFVHYRHERYELAVIPFAPDDRHVVHPDSVYFQEVGKAGVPGVPAEGSAPDVELDATVEGPAPAGGLDATAEGEEYRPYRSIRPRVAYPFLVYQIPSEEANDVNLGFGAGVGIEWSDPLQYWTAHTSAFYQMGTVWGRVSLSSGRYLIRPSLHLFREPSTVVARVASEGRVDTLRIGRDEQGIALGLRVPSVFSANVFSTTASFSVAGEFRRERLFDDEGATIRPFDDRITIAPTLRVGYRLQANPRDIVPNTGLDLTVLSRMDVWSERGSPQRYAQARGTLYLPFLYRSSTGLELHAAVHAQNRGGIVDLTSFFPRGYEGDPAFLNGGFYSKIGLEVTQPIWYIDDGFLLLPIYFKAVFAYGFAETMDELDAEFDVDRRSVVGAGVGLQVRLWHQLDLTLRVAPVYRLRTRDWAISLR